MLPSLLETKTMADSRYSYSRKEMEDIIDRGGSVMHGQQIITDKAALPSHAELAQGDPAAEARTQADIDAQIRQLEAQKSALVEGAAAREKARQDAEKADAEAQKKADAERAEAEKAAKDAEKK